MCKPNNNINYTQLLYMFEKNGCNNVICSKQSQNLYLFKWAIRNVIKNKPCTIVTENPLMFVSWSE